MLICLTEHRRCCKECLMRKQSEPAFMYLPACLMSHTGGRSTFFPLIALTSSGSSAVPTVDSSATTSETAPRQKMPNLTHSPKVKSPSRGEEETSSAHLQRHCSGPRRAGARARRWRTSCRCGGGRWMAARAAGMRSPLGRGCEMLPRFSRMREGEGSPR
jgi:hypothetical protein